jgi:Domain of unknown function (DUF4384)
MNRAAALLVVSLLAPDAAVRVMLDRPVYAPGLSGHVEVRAGRDGYLLVLHADPTGRVRVAFPLDPGAPNRVRAGDVIDIVSRKGRAAFTVQDSAGSGRWYAAISATPFQIDSFVRGDHWDYRRVPVLALDHDWNADLTAFVARLARDRFDYDVAAYQVVPVPRIAKPPRPGPPDPLAIPRYPGVRM